MFRARSAGPRRLAALLVLGALAACKPVDTDRPHAPSLDALTGRTTRATWRLSGAAEPGARIVVTRLPLLDPASVPATYASASDARFSVEVPLFPHVQNVFEVSAVDEAGLGSESTEVKVEQVDPAPKSVVLDVVDATPRLGAEGKAELKARARVAMDDGSSAEGQPVVFHVDGLDAPADVSGRADASGEVRVTVRGLTRLGAGTLTASVPGSALVSEEVPFLVRSGLPASATLQLSANTPSGAVSGADITLPAGIDVSTRVTALDAAGNPVPAAFNLEVSGNALVAGGIVRFVSPGRATVTAHVETIPGGPELLATATATVTATTQPGPSTLVVTFPASVTSGVATPWRAVVVGEDGQLTDASATVSVSDTRAVVSSATKSITFTSAGRQTATFNADSATGQHLSATVVTMVRPGPVATLEALLAGTAAPLSSPLPVGPRAALALTVNARDAGGNPVPDAPLAVDADPGVDVFGSTITSPSAPGTYAVAITSPGSAARAVAVLAVQQQPAAGVSVHCPAQALAGVPVVCSARVTDAAGNAVASTVTWTVEPSNAGSVANGRANLTAAGTAIVRASVGPLSGTAAVDVAPAAPNLLQLSVSPASLAVGQTAQVTTRVSDAYGNVLALPVALSTDLPNALVGGGTLANVQVAGSFRVVARAVSGEAALESVQPITITAQPAASVKLALSAAKAVAGTAVKVTTSFFDSFGNPASGSTAASILVDGAPPDGLSATFAAATGNLTVYTPGPHRIDAVAGSASDSRILDVSPAADTIAPDVSVWLDRYVPTVPAPQYYHPQQTVGVTVRARDDRGLAGVRVRVSGGDFGVLFDQSVPFDAPVSEYEHLFLVQLPAERVGTFTVTATVSDTANHSTDAAPVGGTVDYHFDRFTFGGLAAGASARSISVDPGLAGPGALAFAGSAVMVVGVPGGTPAVLTPGAGGLVTKSSDLPPLVTDVNALAASPAGNVYFGGHQNGGLADDEMLFRIVPGVPAPEAYTVPALATSAPDWRLTGISIDRRSASGQIFAGEAEQAGSTAPQGRLYSVPLQDGTSGYTVNVSTSGYTATLADLRPVAVCVQDVANPTELYFTADRVGSTRMVGLYKVALTSGHLPSGSVTASTLFEEPKDPVSGLSIFYGPCIHHPTSGSVLFTSAARQNGTTWTGGRLLGCASTGCTASTVVKLVLPASGSDLGPIGGLARGGTSLYLSEPTVNRIFRLDGMF